MPRSQKFQVRRGTAAEWAAADPVLAAGEPGVDTEQSILKVGDGSTTWSNLFAIGVRNDHNAKYWWPEAAFEGTADYVSGASTTNVPPYYAFDSSTSEFIKWAWVPGDGWDAYTVRFGVISPSAAGAADARWRYSEAHLDIASGSFLTSPSEVNSVTLTAPAALGTGNTYTDLATEVESPGDLTLILSLLERLPGHADDVFANDLGVYVTTATRV